MNTLLPIAHEGTLVQTPTLNDFFQAFLVSLEVKQRVGSLTIHRYKDSLRRFIDFFGDMGLYDLNVGVVEAWQKHLTESAPSPKTIIPHLSCLRSFIGWLEYRGIKPPIYKAQIELPRIHRTLRSIPTEDEIRKLLMFDATTREHIRNKAILMFLCTSGVRVSELVGLLRANVNLKECSFTLIGKGSYQRLGFFSEGAKWYLEKYWSTRSDTLPYAFVQLSHRFQAKPITSRSIQRMIEKRETEAGTGHYGVHGYRHAFATKALNGGIDLFQVSQLMGHQSIQTTQIYLHVTNTKLQKAHKEVFKKWSFR